ncbi:hypothetical protein QBC39DRAFT_109232 [Podospora conica]|nr:hypothetical protein QBC39DRAFT_109232 [Schizothecium conicum]
MGRLSSRQWCAASPHHPAEMAMFPRGPPISFQVTARLWFAHLCFFTVSTGLSNTSVSSCGETWEPGCLPLSVWSLANEWGVLTSGWKLRKAKKENPTPLSGMMDWLGLFQRSPPPPKAMWEIPYLLRFCVEINHFPSFLPCPPESPPSNSSVNNRKPASPGSSQRCFSHQQGSNLIPPCLPCRGGEAAVRPLPRAGQERHTTASLPPNVRPSTTTTRLSLQQHPALTVWAPRIQTRGCGNQEHPV